MSKLQPVKKEEPSRLTTEGAHGALPGFEDFFREVFETYKQTVGTLLGLVLVSSAISIIIVIFGIVAVTGTGLWEHVVSSGAPLIGVALIFLFLILSGFAVLMAWVQVVFGLAAISVIVARREGKIITMSASLGTATKKGWTYLVASALVTLMALGGLIWGVIPGIWLGISFSLVVAVIAIENRKGFDAVLRSFDLVRGSWWYVAIRFLLVGIFLGVVSLIPLIGGIISFVLGPIATVTTVLLYFRLSARGTPPIPTTPDRKLQFGLFALPLLLLFALLFLPLIRNNINMGIQKILTEFHEKR